MLLNKMNDKKTQEFLCAAENGELEILKMLKESGADIHGVDANGNNALHLASMYSGDVSTVEWLLELKSIDINSRGEYGMTAFLLAASKGKYKILRLLENCRADIHAVDINGYNALHLASMYSGDVSTVEWLLELKGIDINSRGGYGMTAFLLAAFKGKDKILRLLKNRGADVLAVNVDGNNALHLASMYSGDVSTVKWLLKLNKFDINGHGFLGRTAFLCAAIQNQKDVLELLQEEGADIHAVDKHGDDALHLASMYPGNISTLKWLLALNEFNIDGRNFFGRTSFLCAAVQNQQNVLELLQEKGANIHAVDKYGDNALHLASTYSDNLSTVEWLLALNEFDIGSRNSFGQTAFMRAAQKGQQAILRVFENHGANVHAVDRDNNNALQSTASKSQVDILKALKGSTVNIHVVDEPNSNTLHHALSYDSDNQTVVEELRDQGEVEAQSDNHEESDQRRFSFRK
ncbi:MAG: ankyrin repeat domain-containing protein [Gammaproteobacteria bacterium]